MKKTKNENKVAGRRFNSRWYAHTERPTVPRPNITTLDPLDILATFQAAPKPTIILTMLGCNLFSFRFLSLAPLVRNFNSIS